MLRQNGVHASPAPSSPNLPKEVAETTRARFSFPDAQKERRREGKRFYIPLGLRILLNTPTRPPSRGMGDTASVVYTAESFRVDGAAARGAVRHRCHKALAGGTRRATAARAQTCRPSSVL